MAQTHDDFVRGRRENDDVNYIMYWTDQRRFMELRKQDPKRIFSKRYLYS